MTIALRRFCFSLLTALAAIPLILPIAAPVKPASEASPPPAPTKLVVEVTGRHYRWHFRCLEPAGSPMDTADATAMEELHLPAGASVEFRFTSDDYIYLCKIPEIGIAQIAVPGMTHQCVRELGEPGTYDMRVDPLCSFRFYHDELMGRIVVEKDFRIVELSEST
ncbi:MAG: hypothetical protein ABI614_19450 [Planctomycetota bacterium]